VLSEIVAPEHGLSQFSVTTKTSMSLRNISLRITSFLDLSERTLRSLHIISGRSE